jgi:hypothetical protein
MPPKSGQQTIHVLLVAIRRLLGQRGAGFRLGSRRFQATAAPVKARGQVRDAQDGLVRLENGQAPRKKIDLANVERPVVQT